MAYSFNPSIVTNGLLMNLDAASLRSYSGSGTAWTDISGNAIPATLQNSGAGTVSFASGASTFAAPDATSAVGYYLVNDSRISTLTTQLSVECWFLVNNFYTSSGRTMAVPVSGRATETNQPFGFEVRAGGIIGAGLNASGTWFSSTTGAIVEISKWICINQTTDDANKVLKTYYNGALVNTMAFTGTPLTGNGILLGRGFYGGTLNYSGKIAIVRVYNRTLLDFEVLQNYKAMKGRFGL